MRKQVVTFEPDSLRADSRALPPRESDLVETLIGIRTRYLHGVLPSSTFTCFAFSFISSTTLPEGDDTFAL